MIGNLDTVENAVSNYKPSPAVLEFTKKAQQDYQIGHDILTKEWAELNNASVIDDTNRGRMMLNAFVDESFDDPNERFRRSGILIKGKRAIFECSLLVPGFEKDDFAKKYYGRIVCPYIDFLLEDEQFLYNSEV